MKNSIYIFISLSILALVAYYIFPTSVEEEAEKVMVTDYKNAKYTIDGRKVQLKNGSATTETDAGSATIVNTKYFGNEIMKDLDEDGRTDIAFILTQETGGSGSFYYVVGALNKESGYVGTEAVLLGDRIAPQSTESGPGRSIIVNYAVREAGEAMTTPPTVGKSMRLILDPVTNQFGVVSTDFEGEANPEVMKLTMKGWVWQEMMNEEGKVIKPKKPDAFVLSFEEDGRFSVKTDCNSNGGSYITDSVGIEFGEIMATKMYCEGAQEAEFIRALMEAKRYEFSSKGELLLRFESGGTMTLR